MCIEGNVTIADAGYGDGTLIVIYGGTPLNGNFIINGGTVKVKATAMGHALGGSLTVNGGAVYLAGGGGAQAVDSEIGGGAEWYGWDGGSWQNVGLNYQSQYVTTDDNSGNPTEPENSYWNW